MWACLGVGSLSLNKAFLCKWSWWWKGELSRDRLYVENMERKKGGGRVVMWEMSMVLSYEKLLGRIELSLIVEFPFLWVMGGGWSFGWVIVCFFFIFVCFSLMKKGLGDWFKRSNKEKGHWNPYFSRQLNDWELENVEQFFSRFQGKVVNRE